MVFLGECPQAPRGVYGALPPIGGGLCGGAAAPPA